MKNVTTYITCAFLLFAPTALAVQLVSDGAIKSQKQATKSYKLKNGIPVTFRTISKSDLLQVNVVFSHGLKELPPGQKILQRYTWGTMPMAAKGWPKSKVFELTEKYSIGLACSGGIEASSCSLSTLNEYWDESLPLFSAVINTPSFTEEDSKLMKDRLVAQLKAAPSNPSSYVNEIVNRVFYPIGHPYRLNHDEGLKQLENLGRKDMVEHHKSVLNASIMQIVVVGSMNHKKMLADLEKAFGSIKKGPRRRTIVKAPIFSLKNALEFEHREIPTAYMRAKFVAPPVTDKDAMATELMFKILDEELGEEIRTRRSLSYAVFSYVIQYSMGIGVISASTSKPKETLEAMDVVLKKVKNKLYTKEVLEEYKRGFATDYFLTQETNSRLASAISGSKIYFNSPNYLYDMPRRLDAITPSDIRTAARKVLVNFNMGVIFDKNKFDDKWAMSLIKKHLASETGKGS